MTMAMAMTIMLMGLTISIRLRHGLKGYYVVSVLSFSSCARSYTKLTAISESGISSIDALPNKLPRVKEDQLSSIPLRILQNRETQAVYSTGVNLRTGTIVLHSATVDQILTIVQSSFPTEPLSPFPNPVTKAEDLIALLLAHELGHLLLLHRLEQVSDVLF